MSVSAVSDGSPAAPDPGKKLVDDLTVDGDAITLAERPSQLGQDIDFH